MKWEVFCSVEFDKLWHLYTPEIAIISKVTSCHFVIPAFKPLPTHLIPRQPICFLCLKNSLYFLELYVRWNHVVCTFWGEGGFFHTTWLFWDSAILLHVPIVSIVCSFLLVRSIPVFGYNHNLFIHSPVEGCLDYFQFCFFFWLLQIKLLWTFIVWTYAFFPVNTWSEIVA